MIVNFSDYLRYLKEDRRAKGLTDLSPVQYLLCWAIDPTFKLQVLLRTLEWAINTRQPALVVALCKLVYWRFAHRYGMTIPPNVFGPGLAIEHVGTITINDESHIGPGAMVFPGVSIGTQAGVVGSAPQIGANAYLGPGAKLFGPIKIGDNVAVGANAVVNKSFPDSHLTLCGMPAKIVSKKGSLGLTRLTRSQSYRLAELEPTSTVGMAAEHREIISSGR